MAQTRRIERDHWETYLDHFTRQHLNDDGGIHKAAVVEVMSPSFGDQLAAVVVPLLGLAYDPASDALEVALEDLDHLVFRPSELWVIEDDDGFISTLEVISGDGTKHIIYVRQSGPLAVRYEVDLSPRP
jgi:hypothetical protein